MDDLEIRLECLRLALGHHGEAHPLVMFRVFEAVVKGESDAAISRAADKAKRRFKQSQTSPGS